MATQTTNYEFVKPDGNENADIIIFDNNMDSLDSEINKASATLAIIQNTDNATADITDAAYVFWKNSLRRASGSIATGDTLSDENLLPVSNGALNEPAFPQVRTVTWTYTVNAKSYKSSNLKTIIDNDLPIGKRCLGICGFNSGSTAVHFYRLIYADEDNSIGVKSLSGSKLSNKTATIHYLCV